jgi:hypothetical protein
VGALFKAVDQHFIYDYRDQASIIISHRLCLESPSLTYFAIAALRPRYGDNDTTYTR